VFSFRASKSAWAKSTNRRTEGRSNAAIAAQLAITEKAVVRHVSHIYEELGIDRRDADHRRVLAVVRYLSK
jgi:DNA-binding NarL/FixJ family response regulator